jgi:hypothetical protein
MHFKFYNQSLDLIFLYIHNFHEMFKLKVVFKEKLFSFDAVLGLNQRLVTLDRYISLFWLSISPPYYLILSAEI